MQSKRNMFAHLENTKCPWESKLCPYVVKYLYHFLGRNFLFQDEILICNMNNGTVEFVDFHGAEQLVLPPQDGHGPKSFREPSVATVTLQHDDSEYSKQCGYKE